MPPDSRPTVRRVIRRAPAPASSYEDDAPPRRPAPVDEADDAPPSRLKRPTARPDIDQLVTSGWEGKRQLATEMPGDFAKDFKLTTSKTIIKFLDEKPVTNYRQHWADWLPKGSKLSYVCLRVNCPICDIGDQGSARIGFNIVDFTNPEQPANAVFTTGMKVANLIESFAREKPTSPINRPDVYFAAWKTEEQGKRRTGGTTQTNLKDVKARDLLEDFDIEPLTDAEIAAFEDKKFTREQILTISTVEELEAVADAYSR
jgi:hypothetical protein